MRVFSWTLMCMFFVGCGGGSGGNKAPPTPISSSIASAAKVASSSASSSIPSSEAVSSSLSSVVSSSVATSLSPVRFTAWIGEKDTIVEFDESANGMSFIRTSNSKCDYRLNQDCEFVENDISTGATVIDSKLILGGHANYFLKNGNNIAQLFVDSVSHSAEYGTSESFIFDNKLWLLGRDANNESVIWSSIDGKNWKKEMVRAPFSARRYHKVVQFNNQLWLIGGLTESGPTNDIWSSSDGINWIAQTRQAEFSPRSEHRSFSFAGKLWIFGGIGINKAELTDVWSSTDGVAWKKEVDSVPFDLHGAVQIIVHKNQLVAIAGWAGGVTHSDSDIWTSQDGISWLNNGRFESQGFSAIYNPIMYEFNGVLWLAGAYELVGSWGEGYLARNGSVWSSIDGVSWRLEPFKNPDYLGKPNVYPGKQNKVLQLNGQLYFYPELLSSSNNKDWIKSTTRPTIPYVCKYVEVAGQLYATDGTWLWKANDLMEWHLVERLPQTGCNIVAHNEKLYIAGGYSTDQVWSSSDGKVWTKELSTRDLFGGIEDVVLFHGRLFAIEYPYNYRQSVVWFLNGLDWTKSGVFDLPLGIDGSTLSDPRQRINHKLFVFNDRLWFIYSYEQNAKRTTKAYITDDGVTWTVAPIDTTIINENFSAVVHKDELLLFTSQPNQNRVWSSKDGLTWKIKSDRIPFSIMSHFTWNDQLMVVGKPVSSSGIPINNLEEHLWRLADDFSWRRAYIGEFVFGMSGSLKQ